MQPPTLPPLSSREGRYWLHALLAIAAIYSTLGLAGVAAAELAGRQLVDALFALAFACAVLAIVGSGLRRGMGQRELWLLLGIAVVYATVLLRLFVDAAERTHLFEYGIVALLIQRALVERRRSGRTVRYPAALAIGLTSVVGVADEVIQGVLPNRVFDPRDILFNVVAATMAVGASNVISWARRSDGDPKRQSPRRSLDEGSGS